MIDTSEVELDDEALAAMMKPSWPIKETCSRQYLRSRTQRMQIEWRVEGGCGESV